MTTQPVVPAPIAAEDLREPPPPITNVYIVCVVGVMLIFIAFIIGLVSGAPTRSYEAHSLDSVRVLLCAVGMVIIGSGISLRPGHFGGWVFMIIGGLFGYGFGWIAPSGTEWQDFPPRAWTAALPNSWDSIQLMFGLLALAGTVAVVITNLSRKVVLTLLLVAVAYHWTCIYSAVTSPPPTPWLTDLYWRRAARPYLQIVYLSNAYQFYSPDPGPATEMWVCVEYVDDGINLNDPEAVKEDKEVQWVYMPKRERDAYDPLNLAYYRRLAVTENLAQYNMAAISEEERSIVRERRNKYISPKLNTIPRHPALDESVQFRPPSELVARQVLPSFVRHIAKAYALPGKQVYAVKVYRVLHNLLELQQMREYTDYKTQRRVRLRAFDPITYYPYFMGEFDQTGKLKDPNDGMLYWLLPIIPKKVAPTDRLISNDQFGEYFSDYVSEHAGSNRFEIKGRPKE